MSDARKKEINNNMKKKSHFEEGRNYDRKVVENVEEIEKERREREVTKSGSEGRGEREHDE